MKWSISATEFKNTKREKLILMLIFFLFSAFYVVKEIKYLLVMFGFIAVLFIIWIIRNELKKYEDIAYEIDDVRICIRQGKKKRCYLWGDFDIFYIDYSKKRYHKKKRNIDRKRDEYLNKLQSQSGSVVFLKLKPKTFLQRIWKPVVVVYLLPDVSKNVFIELAKKIPQQDQILPGFTRYLFKQ